MKRIIAIFFLFTFISANTPFGEVIKLPALIHHYLEHEQLQGNISFLSFLKEHYTNPGSHPDLPHHHHDNLPLKSLNVHSTSVVNFCSKPQVVFERHFFEVDKTNIPSYQKGNYINNYLSQIWQPPRLS